LLLRIFPLRLLANELTSLLFLALAVPTVVLATISTKSPDCDDEECIDDAMQEWCYSNDLVAYSWCDYQRRNVSSNTGDSTPDMAGCWTMECVKQQLIDSCEAWEEPEYIDCNTILRCINITETQSDQCAGSEYPTLFLRKV
jgi:hypothetical protein